MPEPVGDERKEVDMRTKGIRSLDVLKGLFTGHESVYNINAQNQKLDSGSASERLAADQ